MQNPTVASQTFTDLARAIRIFDATRASSQSPRILRSYPLRDLTTQVCLDWP